MASVRDRIRNILIEMVDQTVLYHVTPAQNVEKIQREGVQPTSYWSIGDLVEYYSETVHDEGFEPAVFVVSLSELDASLIEPDYPGIEEPITTAIGKSEQTVWTEWEASTKSWEVSLNLIGSIRYKGVVRPSLDE